MLTINRASVPICWTPFTTSTTENKYDPAVISPILYSKNFTFTEEFSTKNACGKFNIPRYLNCQIN